MYKAKRVIDCIGAEELDQYLSMGWFRMKQHVFTTEFLQMGLEFYDAIWLRNDLGAFRFPKWFAKMKRNKRFRYEISAFHPKPEHEMLYQAYRESKPEGFPESLESILYGEGDTNIFNTRQVDIYEGDSLVGAGFFDLGHKSAMGIVSYYEPTYKSFGMGKFATMLAYEYCVEHGFEYFYPGYFAPGNLSFDYKLSFDPASMEYLHMKKEQWEPIADFRPQELPMVILGTKLTELGTKLNDQGMLTYIVHNLYFAFAETSRYDSPLTILICPSEEQPKQAVITYDHHSEEYHMFDCSAQDCASELRLYDGKMICMQHFPLRKPDHSFSASEDAAMAIASLIRIA